MKLNRKKNEADFWLKASTINENRQGTEHFHHDFEKYGTVKNVKNEFDEQIYASLGIFW